MGGMPSSVLWPYHIIPYLYDYRQSRPPKEKDPPLRISKAYGALKRYLAQKASRWAPAMSRKPWGRGLRGTLVGVDLCSVYVGRGTRHHASILTRGFP
jgi:hypothetical protein